MTHNRPNSTVNQSKNSGKTTCTGARAEPTSSRRPPPPKSANSWNYYPSPLARSSRNSTTKHNSSPTLMLSPTTKKSGASKNSSTALDTPRQNTNTSTRFSNNFAIHSQPNSTSPP